MSKSIQPLTGTFYSYRCNTCSHQFIENKILDKSRLFSCLLAKKCPQCGSKDLRVTGLAKK
jgi:NAD-dependent SIR2 family protein deacetylase